MPDSAQRLEEDTDAFAATSGPDEHDARDTYISSREGGPVARTVHTIRQHDNRRAGSDRRQARGHPIVKNDDSPAPPSEPPESVRVSSTAVFNTLLEVIGVDVRHDRRTSRSGGADEGEGSQRWKQRAGDGVDRNQPGSQPSSRYRDAAGIECRVNTVLDRHGSRPPTPAPTGVEDGDLPTPAAQLANLVLNHRRDTPNRRIEGPDGEDVRTARHSRPRAEAVR